MLPSLSSESKKLFSSPFYPSYLLIMADGIRSQPLQIGVLLVSELIQLLDLAALDLLTSMQPEFLRACELPDEMVAHGVESQVYYISEDGEKLMNMTSDVKIKPTVRRAPYHGK